MIFDGKKDGWGGVGEDFQQRWICRLLDPVVSGFCGPVVQTKIFQTTDCNDILSAADCLRTWDLRAMILEIWLEGMRGDQVRENFAQKVKWTNLRPVYTPFRNAMVTDIFLLQLMLAQVICTWLLLMKQIKERRLRCCYQCELCCCFIFEFVRINI